MSHPGGRPPRDRPASPCRAARSTCRGLTQNHRAIEGLRSVQTLGRLFSRGRADAPQSAPSTDWVESVTREVFRDLQRLNESRGSILVLVYLPEPDDEETAARWRSVVALPAVAKRLPPVSTRPTEWG
jgi:hypothetical protein